MNRLKYFLSLSLFAFPAYLFADSSATVSGSDMEVIEVKPENNTGLNNIFVVYDSKGCFLKFNASNGYTADVKRYSNLGGGYAEEVNNVEREASGISIPLTSDDMGYIISDEGSIYYCWVVNYANHIMTLTGVSADENSDCSYSVLNIEGDASPITYYTINGQPRVLSREISVSYDTQEFNKEASAYLNTDITKVFESMGSVVSLSPPAYCSTYFTVTGDRFLNEWGRGLKVESGYVAPVAVECYTEAIQEDTSGDEASNIMKGDSSGLGGSAPANISFIAYVTDAVMHYEWQMSRKQEFENPEYRFYQQNLDYTFDEQGTFYLRFIGSNADGTCETVGDTFTVSIGASALECPNAFSPNGDGVNDMWKVSYRSLIDFHCEIFNRNGQRIYGFDDPSDGWDGTWHGKTVKPGVYYYVIIATGADGVQYKKSGDINIINSVNYGTGSPSTPEEF